MSFMTCEFGTVAAYANAFNDEFKKSKPQGPSPRASGSGFMGRVKDFFFRSVEELASVPGRVAAFFRSRDNTSSTLPNSGAVTIKLNSPPPTTLAVQQSKEADSPVQQVARADFPGYESDSDKDLERILGLEANWKDLE
jgi:hypothetical protein